MKILIYYSLLSFHGIFCEHGFKDSSLKVVRMCPWEGLDPLKKVTGCWVGILKDCRRYQDISSAGQGF